MKFLEKNRILKEFKNIPIGVSGLGLGVCGLGNIWTAVVAENGISLPVASIFQYISTFFTIIFLILIFLRNLTHKHTFSNELKHPLLSSFLPTMFMSLMLVGGFFGSLGKIISPNSDVDVGLKIFGVIIWYVAVIGHLVVFGLFSFFILKNHKIKSDNLFASWFVPPVGIIVACTVYSSFSNVRMVLIPNELAQAIWYFGFGLYLIFLPIVSYKLVFHRSEDKNTLPSLAIYGAPANLSLAGFLNVFTSAKSYQTGFINTIVIILTALAICTTIIVYLLLIRIFYIKFNPTYASLTFPLAIGATATYKSSDYIHNLAGNNSYVNDAFWVVRIIAYIELVVATIVIAYVFVQYLLLIYTRCFLKKQNN